MNGQPKFDHTYEGTGELRALPFAMYTQPGTATGNASLARYATNASRTPGIGVVGLIDSDRDNVAIEVTPALLDDLITRLGELRDVLQHQAANA